MTTVLDIYNYIDSFAPFATAEDYDNVGILVGNRNQTVTKALVSLDITREVVNEAVNLGAEVIISHHPVIFNPLKRLSFDSVPALLVKSGITALCAHTNLDKSAEFGVNTALAVAIGLVDCTVCDNNDILFIANTIAPLTVNEFAHNVKSGLNCESVAYTRSDNTVRKVGLCSGAGGSEVFSAMAKGCDTFVTGEIKHHELLAANEGGMSVFSVGHYKSEDIVIRPLAEKLAEQFDDVCFAKSQVFNDRVSFV